MIFLALAAAYAGLTTLSLSMHRHQRDVLGKTASRAVTLALRGGGYGLLALALWPCVQAYDATVGPVIWIGVLSAAAILLAGLLAWRPRSAAWLGLAAPAALAVVPWLAGANG